MVDTVSDVLVEFTEELVTARLHIRRPYTQLAVVTIDEKLTLR